MDKISAQDLRIGNLVLLNGEYHTVRVSSLLMCNHLKPIPLTPELLERCGFVKEPPRHYTLVLSKEVNGIEQLSIYFGDDGEILFQQLVGGGYYQGVDVPVSSLHQLQNIYYALTAIELDVKM